MEYDTWEIRTFHTGDRSKAAEVRTAGALRALYRKDWIPTIDMKRLSRKIAADAETSNGAPEKITGLVELLGSAVGKEGIREEGSGMSNAGAGQTLWESLTNKAIQKSGRRI